MATPDGPWGRWQSPQLALSLPWLVCAWAEWHFAQGAAAREPECGSWQLLQA